MNRQGRGQIGLAKLSREGVLSYQTRNEGLKATPDNWWRLKVLLKCLVSVEIEGGEVWTEDAKCTPSQQSKKKH